MSFARHPDFKVQTIAIGQERQPLMVIDNFFADPDEVFALAASKSFPYVSNNYPGVRSKVPLGLQQFLIEVLRAECTSVFGLAVNLHFTSCHFSLVTTSPEQLSYVQLLPHVDSMIEGELALVCYLFRNDQGGTAFYRHRKTGFESVTLARKDEYFRHLQEQQEAVLRSSTGYIAGDTEFYERIARQPGVFNRMLVYRRTSLHSADFGPDLQITSDPRRGRLTLNGFLA